MHEIAISAGYTSLGLLITPTPSGSDAAAAGPGITKASSAAGVTTTKPATKRNFIAAMNAAIEQIQAGDHLLVTFAGHGERRFHPANDAGEQPSDSAWVFEDEYCWDVEVESQLNKVPGGTRILVISDNCHSGTMTVAGDVPDERVRFVDATRFRPSIIQIAASYDYEYSHIVNGIPVFTSSLLDVWGDGAFRGPHRTFTDQIRTNMRVRHGAAGSGRFQYYQEPRYLATGRAHEELAAFERSTPFLIGDADAR